MCLQTIEQQPVTCAGRCLLVDDDDIHATEHCAVLPKRFPDDALQAIAARAQPAALFANGEPEPRVVLAIRSIENRKHFVAATFRLFEDATERAFAVEPVRAGEALVRRDAGCLVRFRDCWSRIRLRAKTRRFDHQGVSFALPLARRRFSTSRPALVAIRALNPCVRARFTLLG